MNKAAIGMAIVVLIAGVIGFGVVAVSESQINANSSSVNNLATLTKNISVQGENKDFNLGDLKFIESKIVENEDIRVVSTRIKNESDKKIAGLKYIYKIGGQVVQLKTSDILEPGAISNVVDVKVKGNTNLQKSELLRVEVKFVDNKDMISNLEFVKGI
ncbi:hypothetical protein [uncultured Clostridium sp.]|uniref:hypothetical protein n=1 Tax=uncultured Clostridium sp. TaxID=59620 RepID=UPI00260C6874|nr:hypothetical protein [uncultured Clostridium sp.]